jgi:hypothetical protein
MQRYQGATIRLECGGRAAALAAVLLLLATAPAQALSLYFTGPDGWGVSSADALASGLLIIDEPTFQPTLGDDIGVVTPDPIVANTNPDYTPPDDPATGSTTWEVTNLGLTDPQDEDLWLVFYTKGFSDPNYPGIDAVKVGLEVSSPNWALFHAIVGPTDYYYPAIYLGDLAIGEMAGALVEYRVLEDLVQVGGDYVFPQYSIGLANAVPEPSTLILMAMGLTGLAAARRSRC